MPRKRPKATDWTSPDQLLRLQRWAMHGLSIEQIAEQVKVSQSTLRRWMEQEPQIKQAITNGGEAALAAVENALFKKAQAGDLGAMCFYLKNRDPKHWSEHPELRGYDGKVIFVDDIPKTTASAPSPAPNAGAPEQPDNS